jgi:hypothetical protein
MNGLAWVAALLALLGVPDRPQETPEGWRSLFNGKDLEGWETWLGKPHKAVDVPGLPRGEGGEYLEPVGLNKDPKGVFGVVETDGKPALRISGEIWGALTTKEEFEGYHFRVEEKWGAKKWPPRDGDPSPRHSGLLYHSVGPHGKGGSYWMRSFECQIQEHDFGDFWSVDGVLADVEAVNRDPANPRSLLVYKKGAPKVTGTTRHVVKELDAEKPHGEWNMIEIYCAGQTSVHVINGKVVMVLQGLRQRVDGREEPLTKGRLQLQSEGAEVYFRNIMIRPLREIPKELLQ